MFSVDNFYSFFDSHYGWDKTRNMIWTFQTHGSKNLCDLMPYYDEKRYHEKRVEYLCGDITIMHDQEPFFVDALITYKNWYSDLKKHQAWKDLDSDYMLNVLAPSVSWPMVCHSEQHSSDIKKIRDQGFVDCYYFWHGMIARDWFRHWKWHADLHEPRSPKRRFMIYSRDHTGTRQYRDRLISQLSRIQEHIYYDWQKSTPIVDSTYSAKIVPDDVNQGAIHIVAETLFDSSKIHITEKTFKPIVMRQPFFLLGGTGSLEYIKNYGFRTFDHVWDESYDREADHDRRMHMIIREIEKISRLDVVKFDALIERCQSVIDYNHRYFFSQEFEDRLLSELHTNTQNARDQQRMQNLSRPGGSVFCLADQLFDEHGGLPDEFGSWIRKFTWHLKHHAPVRFSKIQGQHAWIKDF